MAHDVATHVRKEMITTGVSNAIFNGLAAVSLAKGAEALPLWGLPASIRPRLFALIVDNSPSAAA